MNGVAGETRFEPCFVVDQPKICTGKSRAVLASVLACDLFFLLSASCPEFSLLCRLLMRVCACVPET